MSHLVHGMGNEPVVPDWPPLTAAEADAVLRRYPEAGAVRSVLWRSPRPLSAAGLVQTADGRRLFVKRHHRSVRSVAGLLEEHGFIAHLRGNGAPVVRVLADDEGRTGLPMGEWVFEVHALAEGEDLYRDAVSWSPFTQLEHAHAAGRALAELHEAARGYDAPCRPPQPLVGGFSVFASGDPLAQVERFAAARPAVAQELAARPWREEFERWHLPFHRRLRPLLPALEPLWTHNDLHASNLLWRGQQVATVLDFGLADRSFAVHDLATAIERNAVEWLLLGEKGAAAVHTDAAVALVEGYQEIRSLTDVERAVLPDVLALCHADYALSEIDYFRGVTGSAQNTELAYRYLVDHAAWFAGPVGSALLDQLRCAVGGSGSNGDGDGTPLNARGTPRDTGR
jgi:Ser/Thr protein kinase RdoA (MazF antagonist)